MKKIIIPMIMISLLTVGCARRDNVSRFIEIEHGKYMSVVVDRETRVMYVVSGSAHSMEIFTLLVDVNGNPLIYKGEIEEGYEHE